MKKYFYLIIALGLLSCSKLLIKPNKASNARNNFEQVWNDLNNKYVFFNEKGVDWNAIKTKYESKLETVSSEKEQFLFLSDMLAELKDGHTSLYTPTDTFRYLFYNSVPNNFNANFVQSNYWDKYNYATKGALKYCLLPNNIGYIYYNSFKNEVTQADMDFILTEYANTKGLVIDVRDNTGGSNSNIFNLIEHFVSTNTLIGFTQSKANNQTNALTNPFAINIGPKGITYLKPVAILTNRKVYSAANVFTGFMSQLSNVKIIGDITGGGTGSPTSNQLPNGWLYRFSSSVITLANKQQFESGVIPTINIGTNTTDEALGKDAIIEKAIDVLK